MEKHQSPTERPNRSRRIVAATLLAGSLTTVLTSCSNDAKVDTVAYVTPPQDINQDSAVSFLSTVPTCNAIDMSSPWGKALTDRNQALVDGRCDAAPDASIGMYASPQQSGVTSVDRVNTGDVLLVQGCQNGEQIAAYSPALNQRRSSLEWLKVVKIESDSADAAYIPEVWTQHGDLSGLPGCS